MRRALSIAAGALALGLASARAQSTLDRAPNVGEAWIPDGGVVQFHFVHRFYVRARGGLLKLAGKDGGIA